MTAPVKAVGSTKASGRPSGGSLCQSSKHSRYTNSQDQAGQGSGGQEVSKIRRLEDLIVEFSYFQRTAVSEGSFIPPKKKKKRNDFAMSPSLSHSSLNREMSSCPM